MLVLTRHMDESIAIGEQIVITVLAIEGDRVKLGISAPRDIPILRHEVYEAIQAQNAIEERLSNFPEPDTFQQLRDLLSSNETGHNEPPKLNAPEDKDKE
jgi:carbon storage regulator